MAALLLLRADDHVWIRRIALAASLAEFAISLLLAARIRFRKPRLPIRGISRLDSAPPIHYHLGVDGISLFLVLLTTFLTPISILARGNRYRKTCKGFFISLLVLETGMIGVFVSLDLFLFFLFWEVMLIPMYFLIGIWGHERRIYAALKFVLYTMFGSILMLVAILWLYGKAGTFDLPDIPGACCSPDNSRSRRTPSCCSSARSSWRSRSRCRSSRCTPGCRTRTPKRPRRAP